MTQQGNILSGRISDLENGQPIPATKSSSGNSSSSDSETGVSPL